MLDTPPAMFFPVGAVLFYTANDVRPVIDPECRHGACKCCLRADKVNEWPMFLAKANDVVRTTLPSAKHGMPTLHVVCERHAQVVLVTLTSNRFGHVTLRDKWTLT